VQIGGSSRPFRVFRSEKAREGETSPRKGRSMRIPRGIGERCEKKEKDFNFISYREAEGRRLSLNAAAERGRKQISSDVEIPKPRELRPVMQKGKKGLDTSTGKAARGDSIQKCKPSQGVGSGKQSATGLKEKDPNILSRYSLMGWSRQGRNRGRTGGGRRSCNQKAGGGNTGKERSQKKTNEQASSAFRTREKGLPGRPDRTTSGGADSISSVQGKSTRRWPTITSLT